jgi:primosomal protein N' (replication factor Y)
MNHVNSSGEAEREGPLRSRPLDRDSAGQDPAWFEIGAEATRDDDSSFAGVVFNRPIDQVLVYGVPGRLSRIIQPGQRVRVPLGRGDHTTVGYCVWIQRRPPVEIERSRIKDLIEVLDSIPLIDRKMLELTRWIAEYYACCWGQALDAAVPAGVKKHVGTRVGTFLIVPDEARELVRIGGVSPKLTPKQTAALDVLCRSEELLSTEDVRRLAKCAAAPIDGLRRRGLVRRVRRRLPMGPAESGGPTPAEGRSAPGTVARYVSEGAKPVLTGEQKDALERLAPAVESGRFSPFLIHGVTGSGKTEVYLSAIEMVVARGREAIVLVPEISLTPQTIRRFQRRFARVAVLHSHLSDAERHRHWQRIAAGEVEVVVGARSAVFAPTRRLGLIVVDEEHESTFKQETTPRYHARDVAVKRAQTEGIPVLLGSATPSLETWWNAQRKRYTRLALPRRVGGRAMPKVEIIDLRNEKSVPGGLSEPLKQAMTEALAAGGQVILLLNRRGFHTFVLCPKCGKVVKCHACDVAVTYHKERNVLLCHTCDAQRACPPGCPECGAANLHYGGIGTERLEREIQKTFPEVVARRMDSDTMRSPGSHERVLTAFKAGEIRILLGTQMIAKGLDFPDVTLVGVVSADTALHLPDFRASERTFQLVAQVAGRTGRGDRPGRVLVQTYAPDHHAIVCASRHDYESFARDEVAQRETFGVPPFSRLARVLARGKREAAVQRYLDELAAAFREHAEESVRILGPAPAPILKIRGMYRFHLQLRCRNARPLQRLTSSVLAAHPAPTGIEVAIDVDPIAML